MVRSLIFAFSALVFILKTTWAGTCLNGGTSQAVSSQTTYCPQYYQDTCCSPYFVDVSCTYYDGCRRMPDQCSYLQSLWACGVQCKPNMPIGSNGLINVCAQFYDQVVQTCQNVMICNSSNVDCRQQPSPGQTNPNCVLEYNSPDQVWAITIGPIQFQTVNRVDGTSNCFNVATTIRPAFVVIVALLLFAVLHSTFLTQH
jgi:hypothetical protein